MLSSCALKLALVTFSFHRVHVKRDAACAWQGNPEDRYAAIKADREAEAAPEADAEGKALTKKKKAALEKEAEKERSKRHRVAEGRLEPQVQTCALEMQPHTESIIDVVLQHIPS